MLQITVVRRLVLSRYILSLGLQHERGPQEASRFTAINLLQDAIELFLLAAADHLNIGIGKSETFDQYIVKIAGKISPKELPLRVPIVQLNKARVAAKHDGLIPSPDDLARHALVAREFVEEASRVLFDKEFHCISLVDLITEGKAKEHCAAAETAYEAGEYVNCLIECRKALFLEFEKRFNVFRFKTEKPRGLLGPLSDAPYFAKDPDYIEKHVQEDVDYIVVDHSKLDHDLLAQGIDPVVYWNVWRLTPEVYQREDGTWTVKFEPRKMVRDDLAQQAAYALDSTVGMILIKQAKRRSERYSTDEALYSVELRAEGTKIYSKADVDSPIVGVTPPGLTEVVLNHVIRGLNGDDLFYQVGHLAPGQLLFGYVHQEDIVPGSTKRVDRYPL